MAGGNPPQAVDSTAAELRRYLLAADVLIASSDTETPAVISGSAHPAESAPPWNSPAADVVFGAHYDLRDLEAGLRERTGGTLARGGSLSNTLAALEAIAKHAAGLGSKETAAVTRRLARWVTAAQRLPAIDELVRWVPIRLSGDPGALPPECPYCGTYSLRLAETVYLVACFGADCPGRQAGDDGRIRRPVARLDIARLPPFRPVLVWPDGLVQGG